jgi:uncharacterized membrane protein HdeD (DUF308 family)
MEGEVLTDTLNQAFRRTWWAIVIRGLLALGLGIFILARPLESVAAFASSWPSGRS